MEYLSHPHRILRYLAKIELYGFNDAHTKCMTNGKIDIKKLENLFTEREYMTAQEFNEAIIFLKTNKFLHPTELLSLPEGIVKYSEMEKIENLRIEQDMARRKALGEKIP